MRVVHLNASDKGGASIVAQRLNQALNVYTGIQSTHFIFDAHSSKVDVNTYVWAHTFWRKIRAFVNHALDKFDFLQYEREASIRFQFNHARMGVEIHEHPLIQAADIIHIHWILKGFLSFESLEKLILLGKPIVWTCHDLWPFTGGCFYLWGCERLTKCCGECPYLGIPETNDLSSFSLKQKVEMFNDVRIFWVSPSNWLRKIARTSPVIKANSPFLCIPNPIKTGDFHVLNQLEKQEIRKELNLNTGYFTLLFAAANLDNRAKGFSDFIEIVNLLKMEKVQSIIIGPSKNEIPALIDTFVAGYVSDKNKINELMGAADLYITTSLEDNLPTTVMEALALGLPAMGYEIGGIPELIENDVTGFTYPKGDWRSMALGVLDLMQKPAKYAQLSSNARESAERKYDEAVVAKSYAELYQQVLASE